MQSHLHLQGNAEFFLVRKAWFLLLDIEGSLQEQLGVQGREEAMQLQSALAQLFPPSYYLAPLELLLQQKYPSPSHGHKERWGET